MYLINTSNPKTQFWDNVLSVSLVVTVFDKNSSELLQIVHVQYRFYKMAALFLYSLVKFLTKSIIAHFKNCVQKWYPEIIASLGFEGCKVTAHYFFYNRFQCYVHSGYLSTSIFWRSSFDMLCNQARTSVKMVKTLSEDFRWQVIYRRYIYGSSIEETARSFFVSKRFVTNIRALYERTINVKTARRRGRLRVLQCE